ncbi:MAG TPA: 4'-phosphopantetheinyl transferase superfamily protein [Streptosporangiaceae bacterium]|nr:4'-phosphopantetheinyl transferase superfamily protein [Streptosporangiaceae bacterium]
MQDTVWGPLAHPQPATPPPEWHCDLWPVPIGPASRFLALLDPEDVERAKRYKVESARDIFLTSRGMQRLVLGSYLGCPPGEVRIARDCLLCGGDHGRPYVPGAGFDFSVSHTTGWLLIAVVGAGRVGVDIESLTVARSVEELAHRVLSPAEQDEFLPVPRADRSGWFLRAWTRKEAAVKLTGHGLIVTLSDLEVSGPTVVVSPVPAQWPAEPIHLLDIPCGPELRAAIATTAPVSTLRMCGLPPGS